MNNRKKGSSIFVVIIISAALGVGVYSTLSVVQNEFRLNKRSALYHEARLATESILQQSMADLKRRFDRHSAFPIDTLMPQNAPLEIGNEFVDIHALSASLSSLVLPEKTRYTSMDDFNSQPTEVIGGQVPPGDWRFIDPLVAGNQNDELVNNTVFERSIELLAKATVERPNLGRQTVHGRQTLLVRDAPLFAYAVFYNLPLEIAPGSPMEIYGNFHGNYDGYFQSNSTLDLHSRVTFAGDIFQGRYGRSGMREKGGAVRFINTSGELVNMKEDNSWPDLVREVFAGGWLESSHDNFYNLAKQLWRGNVQTSVHGVRVRNPVGVTAYVEDIDPDTPGKQALNSGYQIIQPTLSSDDLTIPDEISDPEGHEKAQALNEVEKQKYSYKAGLVVKVNSDGTFSYHTQRRNSDGELLYDGSGNPQLVQLTPSENIVETEEFREEPKLQDGEVIGSEIVSGFHDKRQAADMNLINFNVDKLKDLIHDGDASDWGGGDEQAPSNWWNGVVYVDFPQRNASSTREDNVNPAIGGWGLRVRNGQTIPNPSFGHTDGVYGMSLATNQTMYVEGNFNADGKDNTGSPLLPDDPDNFALVGEEAPAALIADSVTFLSNNWDDSLSNKGRGARLASDTEISAAILTGLIPSGKTGKKSYSGGVENFPRFLEKWTNDTGQNTTIRIRGSMVAMFESEVSLAGWGGGDVYQAPNREWGFHTKFAEGFLPPGTPTFRRCRAIDFEVLNEDEYASHVTRIKNNFSN
jgi:hypothetical protein